jgi:hypothetical protein
VSLPSTYFINASGDIVSGINGAMEEQTLEQEIQRLLA